MKSESDLTDSELLKRDPDLPAHLESLGLTSVEAYVQWCRRHGFSERVKKHWRDRCRERFFHSQSAIQDRLARKKNEKRQPRRVLERIIAGDIGESELTDPRLSLIHQTLQRAADEPTRDAFGRLLLCLERRTSLLSGGAACPQLGAAEGNTFIAGLLALAAHHRAWLCSPTDWRPRTRNTRRQFSSLARRLLARYDVPQFMDSVWFRGVTQEARRQQAWFIRLGHGESPRRLDLPIPLTKRMAHYFVNASNEHTVETALRTAQVAGLGGGLRLVRAILGSRIGNAFEHDAFWLTVIQWFVRHTMLDPAQVGPLIDYIYHRRFMPEVFGDDGSEREFSMRRRSPDSLIRQMREWHGQLRRAPDRPEAQWDASETQPFDWTEGALASNTLRRWTICELLSRKELHREGQAMRHCVASYDQSCLAGGTSIWSLGVERNERSRKRVLTIELANRSKRICQARGKANRPPNQKEWSIVQRWAVQEQLTLATYTRI